jgi:hypothetical protein
MNMKSLGKGMVTWTYQQYRSNAMKEYDDFHRALIREFIQNSSDAGSNNIWFDTSDDKLVVLDDGCGMDMDIIQNKLLVIGGTEKADGSVGGLGKAKELLFFSWPNWTIETNGYTVKGVGGEYEIFESKDPLTGTKVTLDIIKDEGGPSLDYIIDRVAKECHIKADIYLNNDVIRPYYKLGKAVKVVPGLGVIHHLKSQNGSKITDQYNVSVCINGCWMFDRWVGPHEGSIVLNIDPNMVDPMSLVTGSRDNLKYEYAQKLDKVLQDIAINKKSALVKREPTMNLIKGDGMVYVPPTDEELDDMAKVFAVKANPQAILEELEVVNENFQLDQDRINDILKTDIQDVEEMRHILCAFDKIVNYEPDFIIFEDPENDYWGKSRIKTFMKTQKASTIAQVWTETLKQVLWDNKISIRFTAGFCFDKQSEAMYLRQDGKEYFLINPRFVPPTGIQNKVCFVNYMRTTAVHEITHRVHQDHDEDFISCYHAMEAKTWNSHRLYSKIGKLR